ncbi:MAG: integrase arm-type DNA-binding domain-containing protein [Sulfuricella sp.]
MAGKGIEKLSDISVKNAAPKDKPYRLADGGGLYLEVMPNGSKYWRLKYRFDNKEKRLAFGVYPTVTLKTARKHARDAWDKLSEGIDPGEVKRQKKLTRSIDVANSFQAVALEWYEKQKPRWSESNIIRVNGIFTNNLFPWLGHRPISEVTPPELLAVLRRTESKGLLETAKRSRQIAGQVFRYAVATGRAERDPTPDLKGALATPIVTHHAAIVDPKMVGSLLAAIDEFRGTPAVAAALKLSPLLFCRPGELRQMEWAEINWDEERWEIPAEKMKMRLPHIVPLSKQALAILTDLHPITGRGKYVFPSARGASRPLSENGVRVALRTLGYTNEEMTPHGFRAMARTILDEVLGYRVEWIEHQLAHAVKDANGRAYNRTSHLPQRKLMMQGWADYLDGLRAQANGSNVVPFTTTR